MGRGRRSPEVCAWIRRAKCPDRGSHLFVSRSLRKQCEHKQGRKNSRACCDGGTAGTTRSARSTAQQQPGHLDTDGKDTDTNSGVTHDDQQAGDRARAKLSGRAASLALVSSPRQLRKQASPHHPASLLRPFDAPPLLVDGSTIERTLEADQPRSRRCTAHRASHVRGRRLWDPARTTRPHAPTDAPARQSTRRVARCRSHASAGAAAAGVPGAHTRQSILRSTPAGSDHSRRRRGSSNTTQTSQHNRRRPRSGLIRWLRSRHRRLCARCSTRSTERTRSRVSATRICECDPLHAALGSAEELSKLEQSSVLQNLSHLAPAPCHSALGKRVLSRAEQEHCNATHSLVLICFAVTDSSFFTLSCPLSSAFCSLHRLLPRACLPCYGGL